MPPVRSKKYRERIELALLIESLGIEMILPCTYCEKHCRPCVVATEKSSRCNECVRRGNKCDVQGPSSSSLASLLREQERLDKEEEETTSKLLRLQRQKRFLRQRASEMLRRGLNSLDELDAAEEKERLESSARELAQQPVDTSSPNFDLFDAELAATLSAYNPADPFLATLGFGGGTPQASQNTEGLT